MWNCCHIRDIAINMLPVFTGNITYVLFTGYTYVVLRQRFVTYVIYIYDPTLTHGDIIRPNTVAPV